jgi:DNA-binding NarL/FixJ family response regulator
MKLLHYEISDDSINKVSFLLQNFFPQIEIITCNDGEVAKQHLKDSKFDYFLVDPFQPQINNLETIKFIQRNGFKTKIVVLVKQCNYRQFSTLHNLKVNGIILKHDDESCFNNCLSQLSKNENYYSESLHKYREFQKLRNLNIELSDTEFEVLCFLLELYDCKEIATELSKSTHTVNSHTKRIYKVFNVHKQIELVRKFKKDYGLSNYLD